MCRCAAITTVGSVVRRAALWQSEDKNGKNVAGAARKPRDPSQGHFAVGMIKGDPQNVSVSAVSVLSQVPYTGSTNTRNK
jgi:hypothetical protein